MMNALLLAAMVLQAEPPKASGSVKLSIQSVEKMVRPGGKVPFRFMIENAGAEEIKVEEPDSWLEGLEIWDAEGKIVKALGKTKGIARRSVSLESGGFIGRTVDIAAAFAEAGNREGQFRFRWSFGDDRSEEIKVTVIRDWIAVIETNYGSIHIEFFPDLAPNHVQNFLKLARSGFYTGSIFHRIIPGFMMQGGQPKDPQNELKTPLKAEFSDAKHVFGTVSAARTGDPDSATSQFFICFGPVPHLDKSYSVFGQVVAGHEVVKEVERVKSDHSPCKGCGQPALRPGPTPCCGRHHQDRPETEVVIKSVTLTERSK